ncbi:MAG: inorganic diphosphatase [Ferrimicrobium sp.]
MAALEAIIEIPKGSRNKYEVDHETGAIWLDRTLFTPMGYPADYGYLENTLGEDQDPLDVLLLIDTPTFPGCHVRVRPVACFVMTDEKGRDVKILCVPSGDARYDHLQDLPDIPTHFKNEVTHFFAHYKDLEPGKSVSIEGWTSLASAATEVQASQERYTSH